MENKDLDRIFASKLFRIFLIILSGSSFIMSLFMLIFVLSIYNDLNRQIRQTYEMRREVKERFFVGDQYLTVDSEIESE